MRIPFVLLTLAATVAVSTAAANGKEGGGRVTAVLSLPVGDLGYGGGPIASDSVLVYGLTNPPSHAQTVDHPFTNFHITEFARHLSVRAGQLVVGSRQRLFTEPRGWAVAIYSVTNGRMVYVKYNPHTIGTNAMDTWQLHVRNLNTGSDRVIDSDVAEGVPSLFGGARSDGRSVVWVGWTDEDSARSPTSVLRSYSFATGKSTALAQGGSTDTWGYATPGVSGSRVVVAKQFYRSPASRILLINTMTRTSRQLTLGSAVGSVPAISGNLILWQIGGQFTSKHYGLEVYHLNTGHRRYLRVFGTDGEAATEGRFATFTTSAPKGSRNARLFDAWTGKSTTLAGPPVTPNAADTDDLSAQHMVWHYGGGPIKKKCVAAEHSSKPPPVWECPLRLLVRLP